MNDNQRRIIYGMIYAYADIVRDTTEEMHKNKIWYKQALEVCKFFKKRKSEKVSSGTHEMLNKKRNELINLDATYFEGKDFSPYACMFLLLQYMVKEIEDTTLRVKFGYWDYNRIFDEIRELMPDLAKDNNRYITKLLEAIKEVR